MPPAMFGLSGKPLSGIIEIEFLQPELQILNAQRRGRNDRFVERRILDWVNPCMMRPKENRFEPNLRRAPMRCAAAARGTRCYAIGSFRRRGTRAGAIAENGGAAERS